MVELRRPGAAHLGDPTLRDAPEHLHLAEPQVRLHQSQGEGRVAVMVGLDKGDLVAVPMDHGAALKRKVLGGECREALVQARFGRQGPQQGTGTGEAAHRDQRQTTKAGEHAHSSSFETEDKAVLPRRRSCVAFESGARPRPHPLGVLRTI